jgi:hypothetical protein
MFFYSEASAIGNVDPYFSNVSLLLKGDGTNGSTSFVDSSNNNLAISRSGDTIISTAQSKFGGSSIYFDGNGDTVKAASSDGLNFGNSNFTIEMWVYASPAAGNGYQKWLFGKRTNPGTYGGCLSWLNYEQSNNRYSVAFYSTFSNSNWEIANSVITNAYVPVNTWTHLAFVRNGSDFSVYVDGIKYTIGTNSGTIPSNSSPFVFGSLADDSTGYVTSLFEGYLDDIRITKGVARYTSNFTPPGQF